MILSAKHFKDFNEIALIYCKVIDRIVNDPQCAKSYELRGGRKGSQNTPRRVVIHPKLFDTLVEMLVGDKANQFKGAFNRMGWVHSPKSGIRRRIKINGKETTAIVIYESVYEFVDAMIRYTESGKTWEERWQSRLSYEPPVLTR